MNGNPTIAPWIPEELEHELGRHRSLLFRPLAREVGDLRYCVLDEIVGDRALLIASPWPGVDDEDRLVFVDPEGDEMRLEEGDSLPGSRYLEVGVQVDRVQRFLDANRPVGSESPRPIRIGDVFAMPEEAVSYLELLDQGRATPESGFFVRDVTRAARSAAKAAFSRIVAPPEGESGIDRGPEPGPAPSGPEPTGPGGRGGSPRERGPDSRALEPPPVEAERQFETGVEGFGVPVPLPGGAILEGPGPGGPGGGTASVVSRVNSAG